MSPGNPLPGSRRFGSASLTYWLCVLVCLALLGPLGAAAAAPEAGLERVYFLPQWLPQAQFAGYYVAHDLGFYRREGLEVIILRGGPGKEVTESLAQGLTHFGTLFLTSGIAARARGQRLVNVAQIMQRSGLMLVARKESGILSPKDLQGKKVGLWRGEFQIRPQAFFRKYQLSVRTVPQAGNMNLFLQGGVDAASAMWYNEYHQLLNAGLNPEELTTFFLADHGFNFPEDGLYCLESTYAQNPSRCRRFVQASLAGWRFAFEHPEEALDIVMKYVDEAHVPTNRVHQRWMLDRMKDLIMPPNSAVPLGHLPESAYAVVADELLKSGFIKSIPDYRQFYGNCATSP